jgi:hypothetical protein
MEEAMLLVLYALVLWMVASVPFALFIGAVCRLNEWPLDADAAHIVSVIGAESVDACALVAGFPSPESVDTSQEMAGFDPLESLDTTREIAGFGVDSLGRPRLRTAMPAAFK